MIKWLRGFTSLERLILALAYLTFSVGVFQALSHGEYKGLVFDLGNVIYGLTFLVICWEFDSLMKRAVKC